MFVALFLLYLEVFVSPEIEAASVKRILRIYLDLLLMFPFCHVPLLNWSLPFSFLFSSGIPAGKVSTYGGVADALNSCARAVGGALRVSVAAIMLVLEFFFFPCCSWRGSVAVVEFSSCRVVEADPYCCAT